MNSRIVSAAFAAWIPLAAAAAGAQTPPVPPVVPVPVVPPVAVWAAPVMGIADIGPALAGVGPALARADAALAMAGPALQAAGPALSVAAFRLEGLGSLQGLSALQSLGDDFDVALEPGQGRSPSFATVPPLPSGQQDAGDSLYRAARNSLNRGSNRTAVEQFRLLRARYPRSTYVADSYYWEAYALYRNGQMEDLRSAASLLDEQKSKYPRAATRGDADGLATRIQGALAQRGDAGAAARIATAADSARHPVSGSGGCASGDDESDVRIAALNALMQMNSEDAVPILKQVLARRDACSVELRRKAVFILSQKRGEETESILLEAARNDPDHEVRLAAVQWLSQVGTERAVAALDSILMNSTDRELQEKAIFALGQHRSSAASTTLESYIQRADAPEELRENAIFWLGQGRRSPERGEFLRGYYKKADSPKLKDKIVFSLSQMGGEDNAQFLLNVAMDEHESIDARKQALFWAGQSHSVSLDSMSALYERVQSPEMKKQLIFVYAQRHDDRAVDKLMDIAKNEKDKDLRNSAIFWLGQSHDPRAAQFLLQLINQ